MYSFIHIFRRVYAFTYSYIYIPIYIYICIYFFFVHSLQCAQILLIRTWPSLSFFFNTKVFSRNLDDFQDWFQSIPSDKLLEWHETISWIWSSSYLITVFTFSEILLQFVLLQRNINSSGELGLEELGTRWVGTRENRGSGHNCLVLEELNKSPSTSTYLH